MMSKPSEEEQLGMVVKNLLPVYHKYLFAQYFLILKLWLLLEPKLRMK